MQGGGALSAASATDGTAHLKCVHLSPVPPPLLPTHACPHTHLSPPRTCAACPQSIARIYSWQMNGKLAWVLQELPAFAIVAGFPFVFGLPLPTSTPSLVLLGAFLVHYFHRCCTHVPCVSV